MPDKTIQTKHHLFAIKQSACLVAGVLLVLCVCFNAVAQEQESALREDFANLENWDPLTFPKIDRESEYSTIVFPDGTTALQADSNNSASGIIYNKEFDIYKYPKVRFRWRVENIYEKGDATTSKGDDYPSRIYIMFKYNPKDASFGERWKYRAAKLAYGKYPPLTTLSYIWSNKKHEAEVIVSPSTDKARMIPLESGAEKLGEWIEVERNVMEDYEKAFGKKPPKIASFAVMNDSDNTGEKSTSYLDFIEIYK